MTQRELYNAIKGYGDRQSVLLHAGWEQTRWLGAIIMNANPYDKKKHQPRDLIKLPWDNVEADRSEEIELIKERRKWVSNG